MSMVSRNCCILYNLIRLSLLLLGVAVLCGEAAALRGLGGGPGPPGAWTSREHRVLYRDAPFLLKGINWNGIESECRAVHGLWKNDLGFYLDLLEAHDFNALRIPLSYEVMRDLDLPVQDGCVGAAPQSRGRTVQEHLTTVLDESWARGITVLLDLHTIANRITPYPWTDHVSEADVVAAWTNVVAAVGAHPALMGLELKNEPHGDISTDEFHSHCGKVIEAIEAGGTYRGLYFISGVQVGVSPWGGSLQLGPDCPLCALNVTDRIVFSPHVYGPDVRGAEFADEGWPEMNDRIAVVHRQASPWHDNAIVVTEFGGHMRPGSADAAYFARWRRYMHSHNLTAGAYFWTLPQTSFDTGGLLVGYDWRQLDAVKLQFLRDLQPNPTKLGKKK